MALAQKEKDDLLNLRTKLMQDNDELLNDNRKMKKLLD